MVYSYSEINFEMNRSAFLFRLFRHEESIIILRQYMTNRLKKVACLELILMIFEIVLLAWLFVPSKRFQTQKIKSLLYLLNTLSGVTSERCLSPRLCAKNHTSRLQRWRVVGNVWEI